MNDFLVDGAGPLEPLWYTVEEDEGLLIKVAGFRPEMVWLPNC